MNQLNKDTQTGLDTKELWSKLNDLLKAKFTNQARYETWIRPIQPIEIKNNILILNPQMHYRLNKVNEAYLPYMNQIIKEIAGIEYSVKLEIPESDDSIDVENNDIW